jgi:hypothetical protein
VTRFDAADPAERLLLYAEAIRAHRQRASPFLTVEVDVTDPDRPVPWMQFSDGVVNLDCTEPELDRLKDLLDDFPAFKIDEITRPEDAEGANVRISAKVDEKRIAEFLERTFRVVYGVDEAYRAWVVEV